MPWMSYSVTDHPVLSSHWGVPMPERLILPSTTYVGQPGPDDQLPDISQLVTARLQPRQSPSGTYAQQIAQHQAEVHRLAELADVVEQAVTALVIRLHMASDLAKREALEHNRADLQRFKDELLSMQVEHQQTIERLRWQHG
jgi:hypothetical protein